ESYLNVMTEDIEANRWPAWGMYAERLRVNTQRLARFVNDLLDVAALERGKASFDPEPVDLALLVRDVVAFYSAQLAERGLRCTTLVPERLIGWAEPEKVRQILENLLSNAIKFTPEGGTIEIGAKDGSPHLQFHVKDSGIGIAPESLEKIFNKFEQVRS